MSEVSNKDLLLAIEANNATMQKLVEVQAAHTERLDNYNEQLKRGHDRFDKHDKILYGDEKGNDDSVLGRLANIEQTVDHHRTLINRAWGLFLIAYTAIAGQFTNFFGGR